MKTWFAHLPIRFKLHLIVLLACTIALFLVMVGSFTGQWVMVRQQTADEVRTLGRVIAGNCSAGVAFEDRVALRGIIRTLAAKPNVILARVYAVQGELLAGYENPQLFTRKHDVGSLQALSFDGYRHQRQTAELLEPVTLEKETIGYLYLLVSMKEVDRNLFWLGLLMFGMLCCGLGIAGLFLADCCGGSLGQLPCFLKLYSIFLKIEIIPSVRRSPEKMRSACCQMGSTG